MRPSNERHPGDACMNARFVQDVATGPNCAKNSTFEFCASRNPPFSIILFARAGTFLEPTSDAVLLHAKKPKVTLSVAEIWRSKRQSSTWTYEKKKTNTLQSGGQLFIKVALRSNVFHHFLFASGTLNRFRSRPQDFRDSATLPATLGPAPRRLVLYHVYHQMHQRFLQAY